MDEYNGVIWMDLISEKKQEAYDRYKVHKKISQDAYNEFLYWRYLEQKHRQNKDFISGIDLKEDDKPQSKRP